MLLSTTERDAEVQLLKQLVSVGLGDVADGEPVKFLVCDPGEHFAARMPACDWVPGQVQQSRLTLSEFISVGSEFPCFQRPDSISVVIPPLTEGKQERREHARQGLLAQNPRWRGAETFLEEFLNAFPSKHRSAIVLPDFILHRQSASRARQRLLESGLLRCLVKWTDLTDIFHLVLPNTAPLLKGTLCFVDTLKKDGFTRFWRLGELRNPTRVIADFRKLLKQGGGQTSFGFVVREALDPAAPLGFESHHPDFKKKYERLKDYGGTTQLNDICEVLIGTAPFDSGGYEKSSAKRGYPVFKASYIDQDGTIAFDGESRFFPRGSGIKPLFLKCGDICCGNIIAGASSSGLRIAQIPEHIADRRFVAATGMIVLRSRKPLDQEDRTFLMAYLRSRKCADYIRTRTPGLHIDRTALQQLPVPVPDAEFRRAIAQLLQASDNFKRWQQQVSEDVSSLFQFNSAADARLHVLTTGRAARISSDALDRAREFSHLVRTLFPHPLALRWRAVESARADLSGYLDALQCGEALLCYVASLTVVLAKNVGVDLPAVAQIRERLFTTGHGTNLGDWINILRQAKANKALHDAGGSSSLYELLHFVEPDVDGAIQELAKLRNDLSHGRNPAEARLPAFHQQAKEILERLFRAASFLTDYPLIFIEETARDSFAGVTTFRFRRLVGDHPLVPLEESQHISPDIDKGGLYLMDRSGDLVDLRPLLTRQACPECGNWATFHLEKYVKKDAVFEVKAFEHGHTAAYPHTAHFKIYDLH